MWPSGVGRGIFALFNYKNGANEGKFQAYWLSQSAASEIIKQLKVRLSYGLVNIDMNVSSISVGSLF